MPTKSGLRATELRTLDRGLVVANPHNRPIVRDEDFADLVESIRTYGLLQPIAVTDHPVDPGRLLLVYGERRFVALGELGASQVPALYWPWLNPDEVEALRAVENTHRRQLSPLQEAEAYQRLRKGRTLAQVAEMVNRSVAHVSTRLALLALPREARARLARGDMTTVDAVNLARQVRRAGAGVVTTQARTARHFSKQHPLAEAAGNNCSEAGHPKPGRVGGVACGACWERAIRADERSQSPAKATANPGADAA